MPLEDLSFAYAQKVEKVGLLLKGLLAESGLERIVLLYPGMGRDIIWEQLPGLSVLIGIDTSYETDSVTTDRITQRTIEYLKRDATQADEVLGDAHLETGFNVLLDKQGIRSLAYSRTDMIASAQRARTLEKLELPMQHELQEGSQGRDCIFRPCNGSWSIFIVMGPTMYPCRLKDFTDKQNYRAVRDRLRELDFAPGYANLWREYLSDLQYGGVVVSFDPHSHYLTQLGLVEIPLAQDQMRSMHFTRDEADRFGLRPGNYNEGAVPMVNEPRIFVKYREPGYIFMTKKHYMLLLEGEDYTFGVINHDVLYRKIRGECEKQMPFGIPITEFIFWPCDLALLRKDRTNLGRNVAKIIGRKRAIQIQINAEPGYPGYDPYSISPYDIGQFPSENRISLAGL